MSPSLPSPDYLLLLTDIGFIQCRHRTCAYDEFGTVFVFADDL